MILVLNIKIIIPFKLTDSDINCHLKILTGSLSSLVTRLLYYVKLHVS